MTSFMFNARRMPFSTNYLPLAGEPHDSDGHEAPWRRIKSSLRIWRTIAIFECLMIIVGTTLFVKSTASDPYPSFIHPIVPHDVIQRETRVFTRSLSYDPSPYQGNPSPKLDALWENTYASGMFRVSGQEQELLLNRTARLPNDPDGYIVTLTVFHSLHCLNYLRKTLYPESYPDNNLAGNDSVRGHAAHCIDLLRQTSMCTPDTTPLVWQWDRGLNKHIAAWDVTHSCVDYGMFHEWVASRALQEYNATAWVEGNPVHSKVSQPEA